MNPFADEYEKALRKAGERVSPAAKLLAEQIGRWFEGYGKQQAGDREADRQARAKLEARMAAIEKRLSKMGRDEA